MPLESRLIVRTLTTQDSPGLYSCNSCSKVIKSTNGYTNVLNHLKRFHPTYEADTQAALRTTNSVSIRLVEQATTDMFRWIEWIVMDCLPLTFCERELVRRNSKLPRVCVKTLKLYLYGMVSVVKDHIIEVLPRRYGIVLDGWTSGGRHYIAIFAVFNDPGSTDTTGPRSSDYHDDLECPSRRFVLLAFCPMEDEGDLSAQSLFDLIADTLTKTYAFESVTKTLQGSTLTLSAARRLFDHAISNYPDLKERLAPTAAIVNYPSLESGLIKIQRGQALTAAERTACAAFRVEDTTNPEEERGDAPSSSFVAQAFKRRKTTKRSAYVDVGAKLIFSDIRKRMDRVTLETLVFLHCNRSQWDVYTVDKVHENAENSTSMIQVVAFKRIDVKYDPLYVYN
ncbi:hypothetical protein PHMEG_00020755 [Phytophthora megakarya]|uniref:BED-type domain-containing protein n=1 Tax=Phytophthora megakarya TaxID=4795 RepID=A0A225VNC8_9STRA|nr:hypothetical protein PHMEG_00020755 [Phytophthora megakarya]